MRLTCVGDWSFEIGLWKIEREDEFQFFYEDSNEAKGVGKRFISELDQSSPKFLNAKGCHLKQERNDGSVLMGCLVKS